MFHNSGAGGNPNLSPNSFEHYSRQRRKRSISLPAAIPNELLSQFTGYAGGEEDNDSLMNYGLLDQEQHPNAPSSNGGGQGQLVDDLLGNMGMNAGDNMGGDKKPGQLQANETGGDNAVRRLSDAMDILLKFNEIPPHAQGGSFPPGAGQSSGSDTKGSYDFNNPFGVNGPPPPQGGERVSEISRGSGWDSSTNMGSLDNVSLPNSTKASISAAHEAVAAANRASAPPGTVQVKDEGKPSTPGSVATPPTSSRGSGAGTRRSADDSQPKRRRELHVQNEQRRRKLMSHAFDDLTAQLPNCREKISKLEILNKSTAYIKYLKKHLQQLYTENMQLRQTLQMRQSVQMAPPPQQHVGALNNPTQTL
eukprot:Clim_evm18s210 gene=Clim_evmTU18s210